MTDLDSKEWGSFKRFAGRFYSDCLEVAVQVAGKENPKLVQLLLQQMSPNILDLWRIWGVHDHVNLSLEPTTEQAVMEAVASVAATEP